MYKLGQSVFDIEIDALRETKNLLGKEFDQIVEKVLNCSGKIVFTGMGKSGHIARKSASTMSSLGKSAFYLHPGEALHGDLGMISDGDIVIALSHSGESEEVIKMLPNLKIMNISIIAVTTNKNSTLAKYAEIVQYLPEFQEACILGLAPTSSTTVALVFCDALAVCVSEGKKFTKEGFGLYHPAGTLGKSLLLKVEDIMCQSTMLPCVPSNATFEEAILKMAQIGIGIVCLISDENELVGIITDGDIRRILMKRYDIYKVILTEIMNSEPIIVHQNVLAVEALNIMATNKINTLPVLHKGKLVGALNMNMILKEGVILR